MTTKELIKTSRPRFWIYTLGPFLLGYIAGVENILFWSDPSFFIFGLYFLIPANILIYGVNDLSDEDTDQFNERKGGEGYEFELQKKDRKTLTKWVLGSGILGLLSSFSSPGSFPIMSVFLLLSVFYSTKPIRFKARPFVDAYSNFLYFVPAMIGYIVTTGNHLDMIYMLLGLLWVAGMHTYSAIPDIDADKKAGIRTTAVKLGRKNALVFVGWNWLLFSLLLIYLGGYLMLPLLIYPAITAYLYNKDTSRISRLYKYFPLLNGLLGFCAFWYILLNKFSLEAVWQVFPF